MKTCTKCLVSKDESQFDKKKRNSDGIRSDCKQCRKRERKENYNPQTNQASKVKLAEKNQAYIKAYLETHPCVDCGEARWQVLEFDHVRGTKESSISNMMWRHKLSTIVEEIAKCEVRCANCHRLKTYLTLGFWRSTVNG